MNLILTVAVGLFVLQTALGQRQKNWGIIREYRWAMVPRCLAVLLATGILAFYLLKIPGFDRNPLLWVTEVVGIWKVKAGKNIVFSGIDHRWYGLLYLPVLAFAVPYLAECEEDLFRAGTRSWGHGLLRSLVFGLVHLITLVPLGIALALVIPGLWLTHEYFVGGMRRSTVYHALYNTLAVSLLFASLLI